MLDVVFGQVRGKLRDFRRAASERRRVSTHDVGADTLDYCASEVEQLLAELESASAWLTVEQYAQLQLVTPQTVRNWIRRHELAAEVTARGYRIKRGSERAKLRLHPARAHASKRAG